MKKIILNDHEIENTFYDGIVFSNETMLEFAKFMEMECRTIIDMSMHDGLGNYRRASIIEEIKRDSPKHYARLAYMVLLDDNGNEIRSSSFSFSDIERDNPFLIKIIEQTKDKNVRIIEIPDDVNWEITIDEDGKEYVREISSEWR